MLPPWSHASVHPGWYLSAFRAGGQLQCVACGVLVSRGGRFVSCGGGDGVVALCDTASPERWWADLSAFRASGQLWSAEARGACRGIDDEGRGG